MGKRNRRIIASVVALSGLMLTQALAQPLAQPETTAEKIRKAQTLLENGKASAARAQAAAFLKDDLFGDYARSIHSDALLVEASALVKKDGAQATKLAEQAVESFLKIELKHPFSPFLKNRGDVLARADLVHAEAAFRRKELLTALGHYERAFFRLPNARIIGLVPLSSVQNFATACAKKETTSCKAWTHKLVSIYPRASNEMKAIRKSYPLLGDAHKIGSYGAKTTQPYKAPDLDQVAYDEAIVPYFAKDYDTAIESLQKMLDEFPRSALRFRARYWLARAYEHEDEKDAAMDLYRGLVKDTPVSYLGLQAMLKTGTNPEPLFSAVLPTILETDPALLPQETIRMQRIGGFARAKSDVGAIADLREMKPRDTFTSPFLFHLANLNHQAGNHSTAFVLLSDLIQRGYEGINSTQALRLIFPIAYKDLIWKAAEEYKVDPILVLSLMKQESAFEVDVISWAGAMGLMQVMPATAVDTQPDLELSRMTDAETNIRVGVKYLAGLLKKWNGNVVLSLASYNAGPGAASRWKNENPEASMDEYIERIGYKETRDYVGSILRNYFWYTRQLKGENLGDLRQFWPEAPATTDS